MSGGSGFPQQEAAPAQFLACRSACQLIQQDQHGRRQADQSQGVRSFTRAPQVSGNRKSVDARLKAQQKDESERIDTKGEIALQELSQLLARIQLPEQDQHSQGGTPGAEVTGDDLQGKRRPGLVEQEGQSKQKPGNGSGSYNVANHFPSGRYFHSYLLFVTLPAQSDAIGVFAPVTQRFALLALGRTVRSRPIGKMIRRRKLLEIAAESPAYRARFVSPLLCFKTLPGFHLHRIKRARYKTIAR
jgi:hypothetical protein